MFGDPLALDIDDHRIPRKEFRFDILGNSDRRRLLTVAAGGLSGAKDRAGDPRAAPAEALGAIEPRAAQPLKLERNPWHSPRRRSTRLGALESGSDRLYLSRRSHLSFFQARTHLRCGAGRTRSGGTPGKGRTGQP